MYWINILHIYQPSWQSKQVLDKVVKESYNPILDILQKNKQIKISLNICGSLTELLSNFGYKEVLQRIKYLSQRGQIELLGSAKYHPFLPLLPKEEIIRQIKLNEETNKNYFGKYWKPEGFFSPELAYSYKVAKIIDQLGYKYLVLDEISYNGDLSQVNFEKSYRIKRTKLKVFFRNRRISNIFFDKNFSKKEQFQDLLSQDQRADKFLFTAFDGENLGHHRQKAIYLWEEIFKIQNVHSLRAKDVFNFLSEEEIISPIESTWASEPEQIKKGVPFILWNNPSNSVHQLQWQITKYALSGLKYVRNSPYFEQARLILDKALASDQYWWASAKPWWNPVLVEKGLALFLDVFSVLKIKAPKKYIKKVDSLIKELRQKVYFLTKTNKFEITEKI